MKSNCSPVVFLTVGDWRQKELCEKIVSELESRYSIRIHIISDDSFGCRIGSGGAVLNVIAESCNENSEIIVINSGGMSKRIVNFALKGKALAGIELGGEPLLMLDLMIINALKLSEKAGSGVLVCCSDIPIDANDIEALPSGNIGFCVATDENVGSRHGVLFPDENGRLTVFAHKKTADELRRLRGIFKKDRVLSDTGWVFFDKDFCKSAKEMICSEELIKKIQDGKCEINLYSDIVPLLSEDIDTDDYLKPSGNSAYDEIKKILFEKLSKYSLNAFELRGQRFLHFGSVKEYLSNAFYLSDKTEGFLKLNSFTENDSEIGNGTVLDNVLLKGSCKIGSNSLISDVSLSDVSVQDGKTVCGFRQSDGSFITAVCDIEENPKTIVDGTELWETPRFYKGKSFSESYKKYLQGSAEPKFSLRECIENADYKYSYSFFKYLKDLQFFSFNEEYAKKRELLLKKFFESRSRADSISCVTDKSEVCLPVRVNLSGTWTDAMPYCVDNGGEVINAAVTADGKLPIKVTAEKLKKNIIEFVSDSSILTVDFMGGDVQEDFSDFNLHFAVLKTLGIDKNTVLNNGFRLTTSVTGLEKGSGLGTSSILLAGCFKAMGELLGVEYSDGEIIKMVFAAEQIMNTGGGWQDQTGALFSGVKISSSGKGTEQNVTVKSIDLPEEMKNLFNQRAILVPTGERHFGRFVVSDVADRYLSGIPEALNAFKEIKELNQTVSESLARADEKLFFDCINRHCELLKRISPKVTNPEIDRIIVRLREETEAVSICGAGAGGYLLTFLRSEDDFARIKEILKTEFPNIKGDILKVNIHY